MRPSSGKGWGAFATRRIERGALILSEGPLFTIRKRHDEITEQDVARAVHQLPEHRKLLIYAPRDNAARPFRYFLHVLGDNSFNMAWNGHPIDGPWSGQQVDGPWSRQQPDGPLRSVPQLDAPWGLFVLQSRFNHSCVPNSTVPTSADIEQTHMERFASRDIFPGEEITLLIRGPFILHDHGGASTSTRASYAIATRVYPEPHPSSSVTCAGDLSAA